MANSQRPRPIFPAPGVPNAAGGNSPFPAPAAGSPTSPSARPVPVQPTPLSVPQYPTAQQYPAAQPYPAAQQYPAAQPYPTAPQHPAGPQYPAAQPYQTAQPYPAVPQYPAAQQYPTTPQYPAAQPYPAGPQYPAAQPQQRPARPVPVQSLPPAPAMASPHPVAAPLPAAAQPATPQPLRPVPVLPGTATAVRAPDEEEQQEAREPTRVLAAYAPPWLISLVLHMGLLLVLALLYLPHLLKPQVELEVVYAEKLGEQIEDDLFQMAQMDPVEVTEPVFSEDLNPVDNPLAAPPNIEVVFDAVTASSDIVAPSVGMALSGREKGMKKALLGAYGGTATTEAAVRAGLEWLARNQNNDGTWSLSGPYSGGSTIENRTAATAMALLAFQGAGNTHRSGDFSRNVSKGWAALLKIQDQDGNFFTEGAAHHRLYTQAQATIAICELYGMTKDDEYRKPAQLALDYCIKAQSPEGGWRYEPRQDSDTSVTGWFVMALQSAMMAGLEVPSPSLDSISKFLDKVATENGARYSYKPGQAETPPMTAEGLLCRQYLGWDREDPRLRQGVDYVAVHPIDYSDENVYYWYYATQVMHHMEGSDWTRWNRVMREEVPRHQVQTGQERGSWPPQNDRWGHHGGRLFTTCLSIYMLEVYYRHLPIYKYKLQ